jgi:hypothetical protein
VLKVRASSWQQKSLSDSYGQKAEHAGTEAPSCKDDRKNGQYKPLLK